MVTDWYVPPIDETAEGPATIEVSFAPVPVLDLMLAHETDIHGRIQPQRNAGTRLRSRQTEAEWTSLPC